MIKELNEYRKWTWNCYRESMCKHVFSWHLKNAAYDNICPPLTRYKYDCYSGQGKMGELARIMIEGDLEWSDRLLDIIYKDPICGACSYNCGRITEMQPSDVIQAMRAAAIRAERLPPGGFRDLLQDMRRYMNPYRKADSQRLDWVKGLDPHLAGGLATRSGTKTILYAGCFPMRDPAGQKMARDAATVLLKAGMDVGILGDRERCCGNPSLRMGDVDNFVAFAAENIKQFNAAGVETVVTICPFCYSSFVRDYAGIGPERKFRVVHILPMVLDLIKAGRLKPSRPVNMTVTYHDPCHLVRLGGAGISGTDDFQGIWREPRDIIHSVPGLNLVEMYRTKHDSWCCGAGSWQRSGDLEMALWTAGERCSEAAAVGAEGLITYCPHCEENLGEASDKSKAGLKVYDLLDLVLQSLV